MKKIILFFAALFFVTSAVQSQVKIGKNDAPQKGAILDLNGAAPAYKGGLLLPNVNIENPEVIPDDFTETSLRGAESVPALAGMIVWNTHPGSEGVYMWDGERWSPLQCGSTTDCTVAPTGVTVNGFQGAKNLNDEFDVTCQATSDGATVYIWSIPNNFEIVSGSGTSSLRLKVVNAGGAQAGSSTVVSGSSMGCVVANGCGVADIVHSLDNVTINNCTAAPAPPASISLPATANAGVPFTVTATQVSGATSYSWTYPEEFTIIPPGDTYAVQFTATGGTYAADRIGVKAINACDTSAYTYASNGITVVSCGTPQITDQSATTVNVNVGQTAALSVTATITGGPGTVTYKWYSNTSASNMGGSLISSATDAGYNAPTDAAGTRYYYCVVGTSCSAATANSAAFTVTTSNPTGTATDINVTPVTTAVCQDSPASFTVTLAPAVTSPVVYVYDSDGNPVDSKSSPPFTFTVHPPTAPETNYYVAFKGTNYELNLPENRKQVAIPVTKKQDPKISIESDDADNSITAGTSVKFTASVSDLGGGTPNYEWRVGSSVVQSGTGSTYTTNSLADGNVVSCVMTVTGGCVTVTNVTSNLLTFAVQEQSPASCEGCRSFLASQNLTGLPYYGFWFQSSTNALCYATDKMLSTTVNTPNVQSHGWRWNGTTYMDDGIHSGQMMPFDCVGTR